MKSGTFLCIMLFVLTGCVTQAVKQEERDISGRFDGVWLAQISIKNQFKSIGTYEFNCEDKEFRIKIYIADGKMSSLQSTKGTGYIKQDGTFYMKEQHGDWTTPGEWVIGAPTDLHLILTGFLTNNSGLGDATIAIGATNYGCNGTAVLEKVTY